MRYVTPRLHVLGPVHALTLDPTPDDDPGGDQCSGSTTQKCLGVGDGHSMEAGYS